MSFTNESINLTISEPYYPSLQLILIIISPTLIQKVTQKKPGSDPTWYTLLQRSLFPGPW